MKRADCLSLSELKELPQGTWLSYEYEGSRTGRLVGVVDAGCCAVLGVVLVTDESEIGVRLMRDSVSEMCRKWNCALRAQDLEHESCMSFSKIYERQFRLIEESTSGAATTRVAAGETVSPSCWKCGRINETAHPDNSPKGLLCGSCRVWMSVFAQ